MCRLRGEGGIEIYDSFSRTCLIFLYFVSPSLPYSLCFPQVSKEGDDFPVDIDVARMSELVKGMLEGSLVSLIQ